MATFPDTMEDEAVLVYYKYLLHVTHTFYAF